MRKSFTVTLFLLAICVNNILGQSNKKSHTSFFEIEGSYTGDVLTNMYGGKKRGVNYLGYLSVLAKIDTKIIGIKRDGSFCVGIGNTHGGMPSENLIGDIQIVSNIEAGNHVFFEQLTYNQQFGKLSLIAGLQDLNAIYASTMYSDIYINSSFGLFSTLAINFPYPTFPLTGLGFHLRYDFSNKLALQMAIFDGKIDDFEENKFNHKWKLNSDDGYLWITEARFLSNDGQNIGALVAHYHSAIKTFGIHATISQKLILNNYRSLQFFIQASYADRRKNDNYLYLGAALNYEGILSKVGNDIMGIGVAAAFLSDVSNEATMEWFYKYHFNRLFYSQFDVQYVIHPSVVESTIPNAIVGIFRIGIEF